MINLIMHIIAFCCFLLLASCYHQLLPANCVADCKGRLAACSKLCLDNCPQCSWVAGAMAAKKYNRYHCDRFIQGKIIALELNSFRDPLQCRKTTCNCGADYQVCMQACGGVVINHFG